MSTVDPIEVDKGVERERFLSEIMSHTVSELKGTAPGHLKTKLRSPEYIRDWRSTLQRIQQNGGPLAKHAMQRLIETKPIFLRYESDSVTRVDLTNEFKKYFDVKLPGEINSQVFTCVALGEIYKTLKDINRKLESI